MIRSRIGEQRERDRQRHTQRQRQKDRHRERERDRHRERIVIYHTYGKKNRHTKLNPRSTYPPLFVFSYGGDELVVKQVRERPMAQVMAKASNLDTQNIRVRNAQVRLPLPQCVDKLPSQVRYAKTTGSYVISLKCGLGS